MGQWPYGMVYIVACGTQFSCSKSILHVFV
uniref:Uncharacterized protein n=1 Tax=Rhizophora mucronata TaxID=61149 RepID=A0A2P2PXQ2_RHIMU